MVEQHLKQEIGEIADVTVHIDPEDDDAVRPTKGKGSARSAPA